MCVRGTCRKAVSSLPNAVYKAKGTKYKTENAESKKVKSP